MKKLLFALAVVPLIAAGCGGSGNVAVQPQPQTPPAPQTPPVDHSMDMKDDVKAKVQVNNADDAATVLENDAATEQMNASSGDESDTMTSSSMELNSYHDVTNGY